jgi:hypothetical protein
MITAHPSSKADSPSKALVVTAVLLLTFHTRAADNVWTNAGSGYWDDPRWSLGALPGPGQNIYFTNAGWKALAIGAGTVQTNSQTLSVQDVIVSSPGTDTVNTLLFNYSGLGTPLRANSLLLGTNCNLDMHYSALIVTNELRVDGTATQDVGATVSSGHMSLGVTGPASYTLADGSLGTSLDVGVNFPSTFVQTAGTNRFGMRIRAHSSYTLLNGTYAGTVRADGQGTLSLAGGIMTLFPISVLQLDGHLEQSGGLLDMQGVMGVPDPYFHVIGTSGSVTQTGGTNVSASLIVGLQGPAESEGSPYPYDFGSYTLSNGVLTSASEVLAGNGTFSQFGGTHNVSGTLTNQGNAYYYYDIFNGARYATHLLAGGTLNTLGLFIGVAAHFTQTAGTNQIAGDLTIGGASDPRGYQWNGGRFALEGGYLTALNVTATRGQLSQSGGVLVVSGNLRLTSMTFSQTGGAITQSGLLGLSDSTITVAAGQQQLGQLLISNSLSSSNTLGMPTAPCVLRLGNSSAIAWDSAAKLSINNWNGSPYGG